MPPSPEAVAEFEEYVRMYPELVRDYGHMTREGLEKSLRRLPDGSGTEVPKDSVVVSLIRMNTAALDIKEDDFERSITPDGKCYVVANAVVTRCLDELYKNVLAPIEKARAAGVDLETPIVAMKKGGPCELCAYPKEMVVLVMSPCMHGLCKDCEAKQDVEPEGKCLVCREPVRKFITPL